MDAGMNELEHEELRNALGAFALDAVPPIEMRRIERHVATCAECAHEVRLLREASAELAWMPSPEDAGDLVERISATLPGRPRRVLTRIAVGVAAVSVALAGVLGTALVRERDRNNDLVKVVAAAERPIRLAAQNGFSGRGTVYLGHGRAALILEAMPDAGRGRSYQLWAIKGNKPVSMTIVSGHGRVERAFTWQGGADEYALTIEPAGGSPVPTSDPVLAGT